jgi:hypothetical protein
MRRVYLIVVLAVIFGCAVPELYPQAVTLSPQDMHAAEVRFNMLRPVRFVLTPSLDIHSFGPDADGARGYTISSECQCVATPKGPFQNVADAEFHSGYCRDAAIVIAREVGAQSILSSKKDMIFTLTQFQVIDTLKSAPDADIDQQIAVMRFGGEVTDGGEVLRVSMRAKSHLNQVRHIFWNCIATPRIPRPIFSAGERFRWKTDAFISRESMWIHPALANIRFAVRGARLNPVNWLQRFINE